MSTLTQFRCPKCSHKFTGRCIEGLDWHEIIGLFNNLRDSGRATSQSPQQRLTDLISTYRLPDNVLEAIIGAVDALRARS